MRFINVCSGQGGVCRDEPCKVTSAGKNISSGYMVLMEIWLCGCSSFKVFIYIYTQRQLLKIEAEKQKSALVKGHFHFVAMTH